MDKNLMIAGAAGVIAFIGWKIKPVVGWIFAGLAAYFVYRKLKG